jgi:HMG box factor, other
MLRAISPPLKNPSGGLPPFEVRGPLIALEGASLDILKDITSVVEKALSVSEECSVRIWGDAESVTSSEVSQAADLLNFTNPVAKFQVKMLKWHRMSEDLVHYMTHFPTSRADQSAKGPGGGDDMDKSSSSGISTVNTYSRREISSGGAESSSRKLPVAVLSAGYSLTASDRSAAALHIADAYRPDDHWRWVATMWRGIVGPDLVVYVMRCTELEMRVNQVVEFANAGVLVVRIPESATGGGGGGSGSEATAVVDERLERRLGFEIMEWVRNGQFGRMSS